MTPRAETTSAGLQPTLTDAPWLGPHQAAELPATSGRFFLLVPLDVEEVLLDASRDRPIPRGVITDASGQIWRRFELPGTSLVSDDEAAGETARVELVGGGSHRSHKYLNLVDPLRRLDRGGGDSPPEDNVADEPTRARRAALLTEGLIDSHLHFVHDLRDTEPDGGLCWEGNRLAMAFRSVGTTVRKWRESESRDEPRMALVVRLAEQIPKLLLDVCERPRRVLSRVRQMQAAGRVQQIDGGCLRWLAKQPGRSVSEKAGPKQRVLAVMRQETSDTPENRVIRDLLVRIDLAAKRYLREHRDAHSHARVQSVQSFRRLVRRLLHESPIGLARPLVGVGQANYVLQHDARYHPLWLAYLKLVRQQQEEDSVWRWRHRLWAEHVHLAILAVLDSVSMATSAQRSDLVFHEEQDAGQFLSPRSLTASWVLTQGVRHQVEFLPAAALAQHPLVSKSLRALSPDFVLVCRGVRRRPLLVGVFCLLEFGLELDLIGGALASMERALPPDSSDLQYRGVLLAGGLTSALELSRREGLSRVAGLRLVPPLQKQSDLLWKMITWAVH